MKNNEIKNEEKHVDPKIIIKQSPSQKLTNIIVQRLISEKLISEKDANKLINKISECNIKQEDWRILIENQRKNGDNK